FVQDESRHDELAFEYAGRCDVGDSAVDQDAGVQQDRARALALLGKFDVRDDEAEIVLGLQDEADRQVAADHAQHQVDVADDDVAVGDDASLVDRLGQPSEVFIAQDRTEVVVHHQRDDEREGVGDEDAHQQAQKSPGKDRQFSARRQDVDADDQYADRQDDPQRQPGIRAKDLLRLEE